jgi:hypothetical protein
MGPRLTAPQRSSLPGMELGRSVWLHGASVVIGSDAVGTRSKGSAGVPVGPPDAALEAFRRARGQPDSAPDTYLPETTAPMVGFFEAHGSRW